MKKDLEKYYKRNYQNFSLVDLRLLTGIINKSLRRNIETPPEKVNAGIGGDRVSFKAPKAKQSIQHL